MSDHVETAGNKLYDVAKMLHAAEQRYMSVPEWIELSRVVRHALDGIRESSLCAECTNGDLAPTNTRVATLRKRAQRLEDAEARKAY